MAGSLRHWSFQTAGPSSRSLQRRQTSRQRVASVSGGSQLRISASTSLGRRGQSGGGAPERLPPAPDASSPAFPALAVAAPIAVPPAAPGGARGRLRSSLPETRRPGIAAAAGSLPIPARSTAPSLADGLARDVIGQRLANGVSFHDSHGGWAGYFLDPAGSLCPKASGVAAAGSLRTLRRLRCSGAASETRRPWTASPWSCGASAAGEEPGGSMSRGARLLGFFLCLWLPHLRGQGPRAPQPEQVHLSFPGDPTSMVVTWTTFEPAESLVVFGQAPGKALPHKASGNATRFVDGGSLGRALFIHRVTLRGLLPGRSYVYRCGGPWGWSQPYGFRALLKGSSWSPRFALFGDLGLVNPQSLSRLQRETQQGWYDAVLHIGDFAYDLDSDNALVGDAFMRKIEAVAAFVPYMTCPGNHEEKYNFSNYRSRFSMPGDTESLWYSWDVGPAHLISFSTEVYFFLDYGEQLVAKQFQWLERDLQEANRPERRGERPWIITMGHRPMYCSNNNRDDCTQHESLVRRGLKPNRYGLEDLFYKYGVDLALWAHEHSYERLWPVYDYKVYNGSTAAPYTNPSAPVHIITGSAGCKERLDPFIPDPREWSALRIEDYGYARMQIINMTHLWLEQVSDDQNGKVVDKIWLIKDRHGPGAWQ